MSETIAVVGDPDDLSGAYIHWLAAERGLRVVSLDEGRLGLDWWFRIDERQGGGELVVGRQSMMFTDVTAAFVRLNRRPHVPEEFGLSETEEAVFARERRSGLHELLERVPWVVVNRPSAGRGNGSKPYQMAQLAANGFDVPAWVVVNVRGTAASFIAGTPDGCVYKACSGLRSHVRRADDALLDRMSRPTTPVVLQQYVPGCDVRVHVIGDTCVSTRVDSAALDYRFDEAATSYTAVPTPTGIASRCVELTGRYGLVLAGFDFRVDAGARWWCLEANPVPTFLPYEAGTGRPIGDLVLNKLAPAAARAVAHSPLAGLAVA